MKIDRLALSHLPGPAKKDVDTALAQGQEPVIPDPFGLDRFSFPEERGLGLGIDLIRGGMLTGIGALMGSVVTGNPLVGGPAGAAVGALFGWHCHEKDKTFDARRMGDDPQQLKSDYNRRLTSSVLIKAGIGAALGAGLTAGSWWGPAVGGALGAYTAWQGLRRTEQGDVTVEVDGQKSVRKFYGRPDVFEQTPQELRTRLYAEQLLGDTIGAAPALDLKPSSPGPEWKGHGSRMAELDRERRLVADLGGKSLYGRPALHLVDGNQARLLVDSGRSVFAVTADEPEDVPHTYSFSSRNPAGTQTATQTADWLERKVNYTLTPLHSAADLASVPQKGEGLPEGFLGIDAEKGTTSERIFTQKLGLSAALGKGFERISRSSEQTSRDRNHGMGRQVNGVISSYLPLPHLGALAGAAAGGFAALATFAPGNPASAILMAAGGVTGWHLATFLTDHGVGKVAERPY